MNSAATVKLVSSDGQSFVVERKGLMKRSTLIRNIITDLGIGEDIGEVPEVPLPNVNAMVLQMILKWINAHIDDVAPSTDPNEVDGEVSESDAELINVDQTALFDLMLAANFMDIKGLLDACCKKVANMAKGKSVEELRRTFNIQNDFSPEEEAELRKENAWAEQ